MNRLLSILALSFAASGCASTLRGTLVDAKALERPAADVYPKADAVYLLKSVEGRFERHYDRRDDRTQWLHHQVLLILTEAGQRHADYRIRMPKKAKLTSIRGRTLAPDGQIYPLDPTQVHDAEGKGAEKDSGFQAKIFPMPKATVGAVLELEYVVEYPWVPTIVTEYVSGDLPVVDYRVGLEGSDDIYYRVMSYNAKGAKPWKVDKGSTWRLSWQMKDVPAKRKESFIGPSRAREPFWSFAVQAFVKDGNVTHRYSTWDKAVRYRGRQMYHDADGHFEGFDVKLDAAGCSATDTRCRVQAALSWVTENLPMRGFRGWPGRKIRQVLDSEEASNVEKNRVLHRLLADAGIEARFALYHPYLEGRADPDFPDLSPLGRVVLLVKKQGNLTEDVWIDAACEFCQLGELPYWLANTEALVVDYEFEKLVTQPTYKARFAKVTGTVVPPSKYERRYAVRVDEGGNAAFSLTLNSERWDAQMERQRLRQRKAQDWEKNAQEHVEKCFAQGKLLKQTPSELDEGAWTSTRRIEVEAPGMGVRDDGSLVVPLSFLKHWLDDKLTSKTRTSPLFFSYPYHLVEVLTLEVPAGWKAEQLPKSGAVRGPVEAEVEVRQVGHAVELRRELRVTQGRYAPSEYEKIQAAFALFQAARTQAITYVQNAR